MNDKPSIPVITRREKIGISRRTASAPPRPRFTISGHGSGNTPDEVEAAAMADARRKLGDWDGELRIQPEYAMCEVSAERNLALRTSAGFAEQAIAAGHRLWAKVYFGGMER